MEAPPLLVSVVVPVHDAGPFLDDALDSIAEQEAVAGARVEVVVVDDGSTDGAPERAAGRPGVVVLHQPNLGPAAARNVGLARARGDVLAFLDADDRWAPDKLRRQLRHLSEPPSPDVSLGQQEVQLDGVDVRPAWVDAPPSWMPLAWRERVRGQVPLLPGMVVRREAFERVGPFDEGLRHAEDVDWLLRAMEAGLVIEVLDDVVLHRRIHAANVSHDRGPMDRGVLAALQRRAGRRRAGAGAGAEGGSAPEPTVSVVVPVRGHADLLGEALGSVRDQGPAVAEVIVVDDGSDAADADAIRRVCADHDARLVRQAPSGAGVARNLGGRLAAGTHLLFLDADDHLAPGAVPALVEALAAGPDPAADRGAYGLTQEFLDGSAPSARRPVTGQARVLGATLLPRSVFRALGGFDESLGRGEAIDLVNRADHHGLELVPVAVPVLRRRLHAANGGRGAGMADHLAVARRAVERARAARR